MLFNSSLLLLPSFHLLLLILIHRLAPNRLQYFISKGMDYLIFSIRQIQFLIIILLFIKDSRIISRHSLMLFILLRESLSLFLYVFLFLMSLGSSRPIIKCLVILALFLLPISSIFNNFVWISQIFIPKKLLSSKGTIENYKKI